MNRLPDQKQRSWNPTAWITLVGLSLMLSFASACGEAAAPLEVTDDPEAIHQGFEALNHGPRYFEAPDGPFFNDPGLIVVNPDPLEREPLILSAEAYWLADSDVAASTVDEDTIRFPRDGYEHMRGYRPGHVVLSRTAVFRRFIEHVELTESEIIWHTRDADLEEVVIHGEFHMDLLPGTTLPEDFDIVDTYLYPDFEAQKHDLYERRLVMYDINKRVQMQQSGERENCELSTCDIPCNDWQSEAAADETFDAASACMDWVRDNRSVYADDESGPLLCPESLSDEQCAGVVCSDMCELDDGGDEDDEVSAPDPSNDPGNVGEGPGGEPVKRGVGFTFCLNPYEAGEVEGAPDIDPDELCDLTIELTDPFTFGGEQSGEFGNGNGSWTASWQFTLIPRLQVSVGVKAGIKLKIWKPGLKAYAGIYAGFGFGATVTLEAQLALQYNWSKHFEVPIIKNFVVVFVPLSVYAYARLNVNFRLSLEGMLRYDYYRTSVNYLCVNICVGGCPLFRIYASRYANGEWKGNPDGMSKCSLPSPDDLGLSNNIDGQFTAEIDAEATLSAGLDIGIGARIGPDLNIGNFNVGLTPPGKYNIYVQPLELSLQAGIRISPPLCNYFVGLYLGGSAGAGIKIPIVGWKEFRVRIYGPIKLFGVDGTLDGGVFDMIGCGYFEPSEPYEVVRSGCSNDEQCMDDAPAGESSRCFQRECVKHDNVRVSLGWLAEVDLDLYITKPDDSLVQNRMTQPNLFDRRDCGDTCTSEAQGAPYIENFTFPNDVEGEWIAWVVLNEAAENADINDILYTLEVEFGEGVMRQTVEGSIIRDQADQSVFRFAICSPNATTPRCQAQGGGISDLPIGSDDDVVFPIEDPDLPEVEPGCEPDTQESLCAEYHTGPGCNFYQLTDSCGGQRSIACGCELRAQNCRSDSQCDEGQVCCQNSGICLTPPANGEGAVRLCMQLEAY